MKYFIVENKEGLRGHWGGYATEEEAQQQNFTFEAAIITSDKDPARVLFEKQNDNTFLDILPEKTAADFAKEYEPRAAAGKKIIETVKTERLKQVEAGITTITEATEIDAETVQIQYKLSTGDLLTAKLLTENLADSAHKIEFYNLITAAILELY